MSDKVHLVERAYQLAASGKVRSIDELIIRLAAERHENPRGHVSGSLRVELRNLIKNAPRST